MATPTAPAATTEGTGVTCPQSLRSNWTRIGTMTLAATTGSGNVVLPTDAQQTSNGFTIDGGTFIVLRAMYDTATTVVGTAAAGYLIGRKKGSGAGGWMQLYNKAATPALLTTFTFVPGTTSGSNINDGTFQYTAPTADQVYDTMGCDEFVWLTSVAIASLTGGSTANTGVQFKII